MKWCTFTASLELAYELIGRMADGTRNDALASANECQNELTSDLRCAKTDFSTRSWFVFGIHGGFGWRVGDFEVLRGERGKGCFENMRVKLVQDEAAKRKLSPPTRSFSFFEQASEKHSLLDVRVLAEKSSFQSKSDREQETIAVVSLVIIEFAYKRVRIETCCKQRKIIP